MVSLFKIAEKCQVLLGKGDIQSLISSVKDAYATVVQKEFYENSVKNRDEYREYADKAETTSSFGENLRRILTRIFAYFCNLFDNSLIVFKMTCALAVMVFLFDGLQVSK